MEVEIEEFTVENFHSVICRHIKGPKEQFNYGTGWRSERGKKKEKRREQAGWGGEINSKISSPGRHPKSIPVASCPVVYFLLKMNKCTNLL